MFEDGFGQVHSDGEVDAVHLLPRHRLDRQRLFISPWTVQDRCKAIFEKTATHARREFRALGFLNNHLPAIAVRTPLDSRGHLEDLPNSAT